MHIIVCVKSVMEETEIRVDHDKGILIFEGVPSKISDQDRNAIEEAVRLKQKHGGKITALTLGSSESRKDIKAALAMGSDRAVLLNDRSFDGSDAFATAYLIARAINKIGEFDLVLCGDASTDFYSAQVGPNIAEWLGIPMLSYVCSLRIDSGKIHAERSLDEGIELVESPLPAVASVTREINQPRLPTVLQIMGAAKKEIIEWNAQALEVAPSEVGVIGSPIQILDFNVLKTERKRIRLEGEPSKTCAELINALAREGVLR